MPKVSIYKKHSDATSTDIIDIDILLDNIRCGTYLKEVGAVREAAKVSPEKVREKKSLLPGVTMSGMFAKRADKDIIEHSGFICIDIDHQDANEVKSIICPDEHVYAAFTSCSGGGVAALFKVKPDPAKHREYFLAISEYLLKNYSIVIDPTSVNQSRLRYVSFDPDIYINTKAKTWTHVIPKKENVVHKLSKIVFVQNDFENIIHQLVNRNVDITYNYVDWRNICFAISEKYGEGGRQYFHDVSSVSQKYNPPICDRQYSACLKAKGSGITIATFYYLAKQAGIETYSKTTNEIINKASSMKRGGGSDAEIIDTLVKFDDFDIDLVSEIVPQTDKDTKAVDISEMEEIQNEIWTRWKIRRNVITRELDIKRGDTYIKMDGPDYNDIFTNLRKNFKKIEFYVVDKIINSRDNMVEYNPILDFFDQHRHIVSTGHIRAISYTIKSEYGLSADDRYLFFRKWMIGIISSAHGKHSALMLVLSGDKQGTGKSEFLRRLLPEELKSFFTESKLDAGKDDEILMTKKLIISDDEMGGKSKREEKRLKELTSKQTFSVREPYGRTSVDLNRIAVLCGTSNDQDILNDPTGNRRIIPIHVIEIDHTAYNAVDKRALIMEAYHAWAAGESFYLTKQEIDTMAGSTEEFKSVSPEEEMIFKYYRLPDEYETGTYHSTMDIISRVEILSRQRLLPRRVGQVMTKKCGKRKPFRENGQLKFGYLLIKVDPSEYTTQDGAPEPEVGVAGVFEFPNPFADHTTAATDGIGTYDPLGDEPPF